MNEHDIKFVWIEEKSKRKAKAYFKNYAQANPEVGHLVGCDKSEKPPCEIGSEEWGKYVMATRKEKWYLNQVAAVICTLLAVGVVFGIDQNSFKGLRGRTNGREAISFDNHDCAIGNIDYVTNICMDKFGAGHIKGKGVFVIWN